MNCCLPLSGKNITISTLDVEFKIPDCEGCERAMTDAISNFKGVESCTTDTENQKIEVTGSFNLEKLLKKLMKVTDNEVEIVKKEEKEPESEIVESVQEKTEETEMVQEVETEEEVVIIEPNSDEHKEMEKYMMFSEENPNAKCTIS